MSVKVMVIDDSALVRKILAEVIGNEPNFEVIPSLNPLFAIEKIRKGEVPDVITLDVEMPGMDGITFLDKAVKEYKIPVIMVSSLTEKGADVTLEALRKGAFDFVAKPKANLMQSLQEIKDDLIPKIRAAYEFGRKKKENGTAFKSAPSVFSDLRIPASKTISSKIVAIGSSTGGTQALEMIIPRLPENFPPVLVVQHMPPKFTYNFANRLNQMSKVRVKEAEDGEKIKSGTVYIAPGDFHLELKSKEIIGINQNEKINRHRPSADALFYSCARVLGVDALGVILTGMGNDGALGMKAMKDRGAFNIAQSEETCVVFGMPKEAIKAGGVSSVLPLNQIPEELERHL